MASLILVGAYSHKFPLASEINSAAAMTGGTYANSVWKAGARAKIKKITRLDGGTTADVITIEDSTSTATALVYTMTGTAAGNEFANIDAEGPAGGFGFTVTSGGTAGTYVIDFDYQACSV